MTCEGWTNRETWNVVLWVDNDYGTYQARCELADTGPAACEAFCRKTFGAATPDRCSLDDVDWAEVSEHWTVDRLERAALDRQSAAAPLVEAAAQAAELIDADELEDFANRDAAFDAWMEAVESLVAQALPGVELLDLPDNWLTWHQDGTTPQEAVELIRGYEVF